MTIFDNFMGYRFWVQLYRWSWKGRTRSMHCNVNFALGQREQQKTLHQLADGRSFQTHTDL